MEIIFEILKESPLFAEIDFQDIKRILPCLSARKASYKNEEVILLSGSPVHSVGLVISGRARIIKEDIDGRAVLLAELAAPELFAEVFACAGLEQSPVSVIAAGDAEVLFLDYKKIITSCASACPFHSRLIANMLKIIARKNLILNQKIELLSKRSIREKLLYFFDMERGGKKSFSIPFNREELAGYLSVDRSALSAELGRMRDEGLINFRKNQFEILA